MTAKAKAYIGLIVALGGGLLLRGLAHWESGDHLRFAVYLAVAMLASAMKVSLPSIRGTLSVNFLFILIAVAELSLAEALLLGCCSIVVQYIWHTKERRQPVKVLFNLASSAISITLAFSTFHSEWARNLALDFPLILILVASAYFVVNTGAVSAVIALTEGKSFGSVWQNCYFWSFPYYLLGAAVVSILHATSRYLGWQTSILILPVVYVIFRSYRLYLDRLEGEKQRAEDQHSHAEAMAALHLRTIEALALAIDAKDHTTHDHLRRVQMYAMAIGTELGLSEADLEALRAASLLHDIGKLAVPEHIISKPGKLTVEEFERIKIHPLVGAEILERVQFPYPVVPIVRSHHEKWDGSGYPDGLKGEDIPIGARILSAVDCLDALASDRQYRRALPLDQAMAVVVADCGKAFDPQVVEILARRYRELDEQVRHARFERTKLSTDAKIEKGTAPAAGFENTAPALPALTPQRSVDFLSAIAAARQEVQVLLEMAQDLGNSLSLGETLSVLGVRLKKIIPYDSMTVYMKRGDVLAAEFTTGDDFRLFSSLRIPLGQGLAGWVADNRKPIVNGNPSVEPGYLNDPAKFSTLRSGLAVPLEGLSGVVGVIALYRAEKDAFTTDHLRVLLAVGSKLGLSLENTLRFRQAEDNATIDFLTSLPNARSLFLHLEQEIAHCRRENLPLTVVVGDLDGFKEINDRFGHLEGNRVLHEVAAGLRSHCRQNDYVARMGGDEFVIVMPGCSSALFEELAGRFQSVALNAGRMVGAQDLLSISLGSTQMVSADATADSLLADADRQMYKAKRERRTRGKVLKIA